MTGRRRTDLEKEILAAIKDSPRKRENLIEGYLSYAVRQQGGSSYKLLPSVNGMPDRLVIMPGNRFYLVELKAADGRLSPAQRNWHKNALDRTQTKVHVLWTIDQVKDFVAMTMFDGI